jgi:hypothetical protein
MGKKAKSGSKHTVCSNQADRIEWKTQKDWDFPLMIKEYCQRKWEKTQEMFPSYSDGRKMITD